MAKHSKVEFFLNHRWNQHLAASLSPNNDTRGLFG